MISAFLFTLVFIVIGSIFYFILAKKFDNWAFKKVLNSSLGSKYASNHLFAIVNILVAGIFQFKVFLVMCFFFPVPWKFIILDHFRIIQVLYGVLLGFADIIALNMAGLLLINLLKLTGTKKLQEEISKMSKLGISGWVNYFKLSFENFPPRLVVPVTAFYILFEELIFRGVLLFTFYNIPGLPLIWVIFLPTLLFTLAQRPGIPSALHAIFPMCSAFTMGMIHNWLMIKCFSIIPLIIAHFVFLYFETFPIKQKSRDVSYLNI